MTNHAMGSEITDYMREFVFNSEQEMTEFTQTIIKHLQWGSYQIFTTPYRENEDLIN